MLQRIGKWLRLLIEVALGAGGALIVFAATNSPDDVRSNTSHWTDLLGFHDFAAQLSDKSARSEKGRTIRGERSRSRAAYHPAGSANGLLKLQGRYVVCPLSGLQPTRRRGGRMAEFGPIADLDVRPSMLTKAGTAIRLFVAAFFISFPAKSNRTFIGDVC
jgi:hypothetical protein